MKIGVNNQTKFQSCYQILFQEIKLENVLSMRDFEWLVILVGYKIHGIKELETIASKKSFVLMIILIQKIYIKVTTKKDLLLFFGYSFKNLANIVIFEIKKIHIWMFVKRTNDIITFSRINYFNKCRFQLVKFININIRTWFIRYKNSNVEECAPS